MQDSIVVADFANTTGDPVFDGTLRQALGVDLGQSPYLNVVSDRRAAAALKEMEKPVGERLSREVAREVCLRTNGQALIAGSIESAGNGYEIELKAVNCRTDKTIAGTDGVAKNRTDVLHALHEAARQLRGELGESLASVDQFNKPLQEATTSSLEALQAYSAGVALRQSKGNTAALPYLQKAVALDPNFALAYAAMGSIYFNMVQTGLGRENIVKAYELRNRVSERERFHILGAYYQSVTGDHDQAIQNAKEWIRSYPGEAVPHARLAALSAALGQYEEGCANCRKRSVWTPTPITLIRISYCFLWSFTGRMRPKQPTKRPGPAISVPKTWSLPATSLLFSRETPRPCSNWWRGPKAGLDMRKG